MIVNGNQMPDFLMVGAAKSGTTTLYNYLDGHRQVFFPKNYKEPHYFGFDNKKPCYSDASFTNKLVWRTSDYLNLYREAPKGVKIGDGSTSYLYRAQEAITHIRELYGCQASQLAIVMILRNPIDRAFSHYNFLVRNGYEDLSFEEAVKNDVIQDRKRRRWGFDYLSYGDYSQAVKLYNESFEKVKVFFFEELSEPEWISRKLCEFLEIDVILASSLGRSNPSGVPRNKWLTHHLLRNPILKRGVNLLPASVKRLALSQRDKVLQGVLERQALSDSMRKQLAVYYKDSVKELEQLSGRKLTPWLQ